MNSAVYDANVLFSPLLRDFLLRLAADGVLQTPYWSDEIHNEWTRSVLKRRPYLTWENLERTCQEMDLEFPDSLVRGYEHLIPTLQLPDQNDRHVLAVAIHVKAECIVTNNLKDFPKTALQPYGIEALSADEFVIRLIQKSAKLVLATAKGHRASFTRPSLTISEYLANMKKQRLPQTVAFLEQHKDEI